VLNLSTGWKNIWRTMVPPRVAFFMWSAALGNIFTMDNLRKWHIIVVNRCCVCKKNREYVDHHLFHHLECFLQSIWVVLGYA
jgi:hypothetical protein